MKIAKQITYLVVAWFGLITAGLEFTYMGEHWVGWMFANLSYSALFTACFLDEVKP